MSFIKSCFRTMRTPENGTRIFPIRTLCICIGTNRARIRSSGAGRCITTHGNRIHGVCRGEQPYFVQRSCISQKGEQAGERPADVCSDLRSGWRRSCRAAQPLSALWRRSGASAPVADADFPCSVGDRAAYLLCFPAAD